MTGDQRALALVCSAYLWWGSSAIFWNQLSSVAPVDQLSFRIATAFLTLFVTTRAFLGPLRARGVTASVFTPGAVRAHLTRTHLAYGIGAALAIGANWALFLWAVSTRQAVEAALGYFLMPIFSVALGVGMLGERLRRLQVGAIGLSLVGIVWSVSTVGRLPLIAILIGFSFAIYGLLRKQSPWDPVSGLAFETAFLSPFVLVVLAWRLLSGVSPIGDGRPVTIGLLALTGVITAVPLLAFSSAARRVPLIVLGFLQYINPTLQFLVGWQVLGETVSGTRLIGFAWIWAALVLVVWDEVRTARSTPSPSTPEPVMTTESEGSHHER